jgi:hypothetical protein
MASNSLTNILPKILASGLMALRERAVMPRLVTGDYQGEAAQKGSTIDIPLSKSQTVSDVTSAPTYSSAQANTPGLVQIPLDQWKHTDFYLTDKEMVQIDRNRHFVPMQQAEAVKALANTMDKYVHNRAKEVYGFVGTAGATPFSTVATATDARKVMNNQLAPMMDRNMVIDPDAEAQALQLSAFSDVSQTQDRAVKIEGELGRKFGFDIFMSQNVQTHTAGADAGGITIGSAIAADSSSIQLTASGTGTVLAGDVFTIAGDSQTYVALTSANATSTASKLRIDPPLKMIASSGDAVTRKASHTVNLAFHPMAFAFATRPLSSAAGGLGGAQFMSATDPITGLSLRLEVLRQYKQVAFDFDVLYGGKCIRPEYAVRIAG